MNRTEPAYEKVLSNENGGVVIITAILILVVLSILGISATDTTITEKHIAINDQRSKIAFFHADGAAFATAKLISHAINESDPDSIIAGSADAPGITYLSAATDPHDELYDQIMRYTVYDPAQDIDFIVGNVDADSEIERIGDARNVEGGGAEFGTGAEGVVYNMVALDFGIRTNGYHNRNAHLVTDRALAAQYTKLNNVPGGM